MAVFIDLSSTFINHGCCLLWLLEFMYTPTNKCKRKLQIKALFLHIFNHDCIKRAKIAVNGQCPAKDLKLSSKKKGQIGINPQNPINACNRERHRFARTWGWLSAAAALIRGLGSFFFCLSHQFHYFTFCRKHPPRSI